MRPCFPGVGRQGPKEYIYMCVCVATRPLGPSFLPYFYAVSARGLRLGAGGEAAALPAEGLAKVPRLHLSRAEERGRGTELWRRGQPPALVFPRFSGKPPGLGRPARRCRCHAAAGAAALRCAGPRTPPGTRGVPPAFQGDRGDVRSSQGRIPVPCQSRKGALPFTGLRGPLAK